MRIKVCNSTVFVHLQDNRPALLSPTQLTNPPPESHDGFLTMRLGCAFNHDPQKVNAAQHERLGEMQYSMILCVFLMHFF